MYSTKHGFSFSKQTLHSSSKGAKGILQSLFSAVAFVAYGELPQTKMLTLFPVFNERTEN